MANILRNFTLTGLLVASVILTACGSAVEPTLSAPEATLVASASASASATPQASEAPERTPAASASPTDEPDEPIVGSDLEVRAQALLQDYVDAYHDAMSTGDFSGLQEVYSSSWWDQLQEVGFANDSGLGPAFAKEVRAEAPYEQLELINIEPAETGGYTFTAKYDILGVTNTDWNTGAEIDTYPAFAMHMSGRLVEFDDGKLFIDYLEWRSFDE